MCKIRCAIVAAVLFVGLFVGILNVPPNARADIQGDWVEEIIRDIPSSVQSIALGDVDLDGKNEVVVGLYDTEFELRMYKKELGFWKEYLIANTPTAVRNLVVGDADNDGMNEIVCTLNPTTYDVKMFEFENGLWLEENITDAPVQIYSLALGDANNDGGNEVVIGLANTTNDVRAYSKSGTWSEENITDVYHDVVCVDVGDVDNDAINEVVIGMGGNNPPFTFITNEVRAYEWSGTNWLEDNITDTGNMDINSLVVGDPDSDGKNEVCFGTWSVSGGTMEARTYEYKWGGWQLEYWIQAAPGNSKWVGGVGDTDNDGKNELILIEGSYMGFGTAKIEVWENISYVIWGDVVASNLPMRPQTAIGDCDSNGVNEIVVGLVSSSYEMRLYANDRGSIRFTSHYDGEYIAGTEQIEVVVTSNYVDAVRFYVDDSLSFTDTVYPYQFMLDTTGLVEDATYTIKAEGVRGNNPPLVTTIDLIVNNFVPVGDYISVSTLKSNYTPDQDVSVLIGLKSPPSFTYINLEVSYTDPFGNTLYSISEQLPYNSQYMMVLPLGSDAKKGTYTVSVDAIGISKGMMVWSDTNTTTFDVVGMSISEQLEGINTTLALMNITLMDIQSDLTGMNLTGLQGAIDHLNDTLEPKLDSIISQLAGVNDSIMGRVSDAETNILDELQAVNLSLSADIQNLLTDITNDIIGMNSSLSDELTSLLNNMTTDNDALRNWLDIVLEEIDTNLTVTNATLNAQLADLNSTIDTYYNDITTDLNGVFNSLSQLELNLSAQHDVITDAIDTLNNTIANAPGLSTGDILDRINDSIALIETLDSNMTSHDSDIQAMLIALNSLVQDEGNLTRDQLIQNLSEVLSQIQGVDVEIVSHDDDVKENLTALQDLINNIGTLDITELSDKLADLELNLSQHDTDIAGDITAISQSVGDLQDEVSEKLKDINNTLNQLATWEDVLKKLDELDKDLEDAEEDLSASIDKLPKEKEDEFGATDILLIIAIILLIINLLLMITGAGKSKAESPKPLPDEETSEDSETSLEEKPYQTRTKEDEGMTILFGDGKTGERLPTDRDDINTEYRRGMGEEGEVAEEASDEEVEVEDKGLSKKELKGKRDAEEK